MLEKGADCGWVRPVWGEGTCDSLFINTLLKSAGLSVQASFCVFGPLDRPMCCVQAEAGAGQMHLSPTSSPKR